MSSRNIITTYGKYYNLFVNGSDIGLYLGTENISKSLLERNFKITNYGILKNNDDWDKAWGTSHISPTMYTANDMEQSGEILTKEIALFQLKRLFKAIDEDDLKTIKTLVDIEYLAKLYAAIILVGDFHPLSGDNTRYVYDFSTGTFKVAYRLETYPKKIDFVKRDNNLTLTMEYFGPHLLIDKLSTQSFFTNMTVKNLIDIKNDSDYILNLIDEEHKIYKSVAKKSRFPSNHHSYKYFDELGVINENLQLINRIIDEKLSFNLDNSQLKYNKVIDPEYAKIFFSIEKHKENNSTLNVLNDSLSQISILSIESCDGDKFKFSGPLIVEPSEYDSESGLIVSKNNSNFNIPFHCIKKAEVLNNKLNQNILDKDIYFNYSKSFDLNESDGLDQFGLNIKEIINPKDDSITYVISSGTYSIESDVIFPKGAKLILQPGVNILLSELSSIFVRGDFYAKGTSSNPITIKNKDLKPYGTFAVKGTTINPSKVIIENFYLQGGSESIIQGTYFSAQLSIHIADVIIKNSKFSNSFSDDGINVKLGNVLISNNTFLNNSADQVDLDFVNGVVTNNTFTYTKDNKNLLTDGLDVSGSTLNIYENSFINMTDKGLSIGEKSFVNVYKNIVSNNNIGIALKDGSKACLSQNSFYKNVDDISRYIKKNMYQMPSIYFDNQDINNEMKFVGECDLNNFIEIRPQS